jgi:hypothetical protein
VNEGQPGDLLSDDFLEACPGLTYRRLDHWTRRGFLRTRIREDEDRQGCPRYWPPEEVPVAQVMIALTAAGLTPEAAVSVARALAFTTEIKMAAGVYLKVVARELVG